MKIPLQKLIHSDGLTIEATVDLSELEQKNNDIRKIGPVSVKCESLKQDGLFHINLHITGEMILPCARTLIDVPYQFDIQTLELFSDDQYFEESDESDIHKIEGEILDLEPYIKENVILEIPFRVYASEDQIKENALSSGDGWSVMTEEQNADKIDPRMAKLQSLLNDQKNENQ